MSYAKCTACKGVGGFTERAWGEFDVGVECDRCGGTGRKIIKSRNQREGRYAGRFKTYFVIKVSKIIDYNLKHPKHFRASWFRKTYHYMSALSAR